MKREINPQESSRADAFRMWMSSPLPMVTLVKTVDVSRLVKVSKKKSTLGITEDRFRQTFSEVAHRRFSKMSVFSYFMRAEGCTFALGFLKIEK